MRCKQVISSHVVTVADESSLMATTKHFHDCIGVTEIKEETLLREDG